MRCRIPHYPGQKKSWSRGPGFWLAAPHRGANRKLMYSVNLYGRAYRLCPCPEGKDFSIGLNDHRLMIAILELDLNRILRNSRYYSWPRIDSCDRYRHPKLWGHGFVKVIFEDMPDKKNRKAAIKMAAFRFCLNL